LRQKNAEVRQWKEEDLGTGKRLPNLKGSIENAGEGKGLKGTARSIALGREQSRRVS